MWAFRNFRKLFIFQFEIERKRLLFYLSLLKQIIGGVFFFISFTHMWYGNIRKKRFLTFFVFRCICALITLLSLQIRCLWRRWFLRFSASFGLVHLILSNLSLKFQYFNELAGLKTDKHLSELGKLDKRLLEIKNAKLVYCALIFRYHCKPTPTIVIFFK